MNQKVVGTMKCYLSEFRLFVDDHFVTFNIIDIDTVKNVITVAVSKLGKVNLCSFDLIRGDKGLFFEYGVMCEQIAVEDFEQIEEE